MEIQNTNAIRSYAPAATSSRVTAAPSPVIPSPEQLESLDVQEMLNRHLTHASKRVGFTNQSTYTRPAGAMHGIGGRLDVSA